MAARPIWRLVALMSAILVPAVAHARPDPRFIAAGEVADAPTGFDAWCASDPFACAVDPAALEVGWHARASDAIFVRAGLFLAPTPLGGGVPACARRPSWPGIWVPATVASLALGHTEMCASDPEAMPGRQRLPKKFVGGSKAVVLAWPSQLPLAAFDPAGSIDEQQAIKLVRKVNGTINAKVVQRSDFEMFGVDEHWRPAGSEPGATGDCEDLALEKFSRLRKAGFPIERLFLATVFKSQVGLHTVLVARMADGDMVLDSLTSRIVRWDRAGFRWLRVQSVDDRRQWRRVRPT